jgi:hypothetical protein
LFPEALSIEIATQTNEYVRKHIEATPNKNWYPSNPEEIKVLIGIQIVMGVLQPPSQDKDKLFHQSIIEMKFSLTRYENFHIPDTSRNFVNISVGQESG